MRILRCPLRLESSLAVKDGVAGKEKGWRESQKVQIACRPKSEMFRGTATKALRRLRRQKH